MADIYTKFLNACDCINCFLLGGSGPKIWHSLPTRQPTFLLIWFCSFQRGYTEFSKEIYKSTNEVGEFWSKRFSWQKQKADVKRLAESFYNIKNVSSMIISKSSSKNLSNENKHTLCFQRIGILIHFLSWKQQKLRFFDELFDVITVDHFLTL